MNWYRREPTLNEILSDCIIRAVMESDGIDPQELETRPTALRFSQALFC
jgi:hypothetical protein